MKKTLKVGIIGLRFGRSVHLPSYRNNPNFEVVALCGRSQERTATAAKEEGILGAYDNINEMLENENLDIVSIATPPLHQPDIIKICAEKNIHVFFEKPLAINSNSAKEALEASSNKIKSAVNFIFPEIPVWQKTKQLISTGKIGGLRHITVNWHVETYASKQGEHPWKLSRKNGGGVLLNFVSHTLYYLDWLAGEIVDATCILDETEVDCDTRAVIHLKFKSGSTAAIVASQNAHHGLGHDIFIAGEEGSIHLNNSQADYAKSFTGTAYIRENNQSIDLNADTEKIDEADGRIYCTKKIINRLADSISDGSPPVPGLTEAYNVQTILDALIQSAKQGKAVSI